MNESPYIPLFEEMDRLAPSLGEEVVQQVGNFPFEGKNSSCFSYRPDSEMKELFDTMDLIVCHAGIGTILNALDRNVPMVLVPRNVVMPDVLEDQQEIVARKIESMGRGVVAGSISELEQKIKEARELKMPPYVRDRSLCMALSGILEERATANKHN